MRHLDRAPVAPPPCLSRVRATPGRWEDLSREDREQIRARLGALQRQRCAYCECDLASESKSPHIDHYEQRSRAPGKTFEWENLFWSCSHEGRCGKHKDRIATTYAPRDLLKPDVDEPRAFLYFTTDGDVVPRAGLGPEQVRRARETIRVLALDSGALMSMRRASLSGPSGELREAMMADLDLEQERQYRELLARDHESSPFSAAILDLLGILP